jgi:hypothetical protein
MQLGEGHIFAFFARVNTRPREVMPRGVARGVQEPLRARIKRRKTQSNKENTTGTRHGTASCAESPRARARMRLPRGALPLPLPPPPPSPHAAIPSAVRASARSVASSGVTSATVPGSPPSRRHTERRAREREERRVVGRDERDGARVAPRRLPRCERLSALGHPPRRRVN